MKCIVAAALLLPLTASAHHSFFGRFDRRSLMELEGAVVEIVWRNPHAYLKLRTTDDAGRDVLWEVETSSFSLMRRLGVERNMIQPGDRIRLAGFPPVGDKTEVYARHILIADGRELLLDTDLEPIWSRRTVGENSELSIRQGDGSRPDLGIFRVWSLIRGGRRLFPEVVDPNFDVQSYPMTESARAALAAFDLANENPTIDCAPKGMPTIMEQPYPIEFVRLGDGNIELRIEEYDLRRKIYMDPASAPGAAEPSLLGSSLGRWDGRSLVVTTTRISWPFFSQIGIPQSEAVEIIERFTPTEDGSRLDYRMTVHDPETFTEPVVLENFWIWVPQTRILPYACETG